MVDDLTAPRWVRLEGGTFWAGSNDFYAEETPLRQEALESFSLTATPVTNRQYAAFVAATGYITVPERPLSQVEFPHLTPLDRAPGSLVFVPSTGPIDLDDWQQWWKWVPGANWRSPYGPGREVVQRDGHPIVQVAYADACAYAEWVGGRLPTELELEYAACGQRLPAPYAWGSTRELDGRVMANTWHGSFPHHNEGANGWIGTSPVGAFPANDFGLYDCIGNVWEWTSDRYCDLRSGSGDAQSQLPRTLTAPQKPEANAAAEIIHRVLKGGSHLCAPEYSLRYRPAARAAQAEDSATTHIGFRVAMSAR